MKHKVRIPIMRYVEVEVEPDSEKRDDIIEKAILSFKLEQYSDDSIDVRGINAFNIDGPTIDCEGIWDDDGLITIQTIQN